MKIILAQTHIEWENKEENIAYAKKIIKENTDSDIILFPEMSFTGFSMNTVVTKESGSTVELMKNVALKNNITIGFGWVKDCGDKCENHYTIVDKDGDVLSDYAKIHPFSYSGEDNYFCGGDSIVTFEMGGISFCTFICYDLRFPELFRVVADKVHAIIIPANWPAKRSEHWKTLLRARAIENQLYIFAINCVGDMGGQYYSGDSCIITPNGDIVELISDEEGIICYDFSDDVEVYRNSFPVLKDRNPKVYL